MLLSDFTKLILTVRPSVSRVFSSVSVLPKLNDELLNTRLQQRLDAWIKAQENQQRAAMTPYVEKINVEYVGKIGETCSLQMTKGISSPIDCAKHLSKLLVDQSVVALVNGKVWNMHRPLMEDCWIDFIKFKDVHHDPTVANMAFWRSASFLLAAALETAFRAEHTVRLLRNWPTEPQHGAFVCDVSFTPAPSPSHAINPWVPSHREMRALSAHGQRLAAQGVNFIPVSVPSTHDLFETCFADDSPRRNQLISESHEQKDTPEEPLLIPIYRMGDFVEACVGVPLISSTKLIGQFAVTLFKPIGWLQGHVPTDGKHPVIVYRAHGVALPSSFPAHFTTFDRLIKWSRESNPAVPNVPDYAVPF